jgi:hypothetical protein
MSEYDMEILVLAVLGFLIYHIFKAQEQNTKIGTAEDKTRALDICEKNGCVIIPYQDSWNVKLEGVSVLYIEKWFRGYIFHISVKKTGNNELIKYFYADADENFHTPKEEK